MKRLGTAEAGLTLCLLLLTAISLRPSGSLGSRIAAWNQQRQVVELYRAGWEDAASTRGSIYGHGGKPIAAFAFNDYLCRYCRSSHARVNRLVADKDAAIVVIHVPASRRASEAARAAICAEGQGAFARVHEHLMTAEDWTRTDPNWETTAQRAGVPSVSRFLSCLNSSATTERLEQDVRLAARWKVNGTPTFVSSHARVVGSPTEGDLVRLLGIRPQ